MRDASTKQKHSNLILALSHHPDEASVHPRAWFWSVWSFRGSRSLCTATIRISVVANRPMLELRFVGAGEIPRMRHLLALRFVLYQWAISTGPGRPGSPPLPFSSTLPKIIFPLAVCSTLVTEISTALPISLRA